MKMTELLRHDIPGEIVALWHRQVGEVLLPLQELAIKRHNLFSGNNLLIQAPTSAGKTFIGEMAAIQTALRRKKVVYLVPLKALAEEKYLEFKEKYTPYGIKVIISSRDHREHDQDLETGNYLLAIVVYEKLAQLLVRRPEQIKEIELFIADELELLSDPERGSSAEILLTRILQAPCRLIGLSAVIGEADNLALWLKAELVAHERRPIELRYGVLHDGAFRYRTHNDFSEGEEAMVDLPSESAWDILMSNVRAMVGRGESCLVFVKAKEESRRGAELLCQYVHECAADDALRALNRLEPTRSRERLLETLSHGVAFHNSDLSPEERRVVEEAFRSGGVKVLVSTSTLAVGMNLPAHNVFVASEKWRYDERFGMPWKTPILRGEYENMGGRAGRYGSGHAFGRSILIAPTPYDQETLWRRYVEGEREVIEPQLAKAPLETPILQLVASKCCRTIPEIQHFLESTLTGVWVWRQSLTRDEMEIHVRAATHRALDAGALALDGEGRLEATPLGQAVAAKGVTLATARELEQWIGESETRLWCDLDLLLAVLLTADGRMFQVALSAREYEHGNYPGLLKALTEGEDSSADVPLNRLRNCQLQPFFEEVRAIKIALILHEWIHQASMYELEEKLHTLTGQVLAAADQAAWLIDVVAAMATALGAQDTFVQRIETLRDRVQHGLCEETLPPARARIPGLVRGAILRLAAEGLGTAEALAAADAKLLERRMPAAVARKLVQWARAQAQATVGLPAAAPAGPDTPVLVVDERRPRQIELDGVTIPLQEKQYRLIQVLAGSPGECVDYETVYQHLWGDLIVESNQLHFQRRQLVERIKGLVPAREKMVRTVPKRGFLLDLQPDEVAVHRRPSAA
jgi:helicase